MLNKEPMLVDLMALVSEGLFHVEIGSEKLILLHLILLSFFDFAVSWVSRGFISSPLVPRNKFPKLHLDNQGNSITSAKV